MHDWQSLFHVRWNCKYHVVRRTSRNGGNWGIKVLPGKEDLLAFEPGNRNQEWLYLPVTWLDDREDD